MKATKCFDAYGIYMLSVISFAVVCCKAFSSYWLAAIQVINGSGLSFLTIVNTVCQTLWHEGKPAIIGFALSFIMWQMVLLNSNIPGIDPPTPFTPKKLRARKSNRFHLDYIFAVIIGLFTTFTLVVREMIY